MDVQAMGKVQHEAKTAKTFIVELYEEDETHSFAVDYFKNCPFTCAYIWHDKDIKDDGSLKKKHLHAVIKYPVKKNVRCVAKELQINPCYVDTCTSEQKSLLYLIHRGWQDKYQYEPDEVQGNGSLYERFKTLVEDESEDDRALRIIKLLDQYKRYITMAEFIQLCCEAGVYPELRRGGYLFVQALKEHNMVYEC